jgi:hypothetical protein
VGGSGRSADRPLSRVGKLAEAVSTTVSGLSDMVSMPCSSSHSARSGWSLGPWPQMPTYLPRSAGLDCGANHEFDRGVAFVDQDRVAVQPKGGLGHVIGANGKPSK